MSKQINKSFNNSKIVWVVISSVVVFIGAISFWKNWIGRESIKTGKVNATLIQPEKKGKKINLFHANVYFSKGAQGVISLYSLNSREEVVKHPYAGAPYAGLRRYEGEFYLIFKELKLDLGEMTFVENTYHAGALRVEKLNPDNNQDFIIIFQYGTSNFEMAKFYGYDFKQRKLIKYNFKWIAGNINDEIYFLPRGNDFKILPSKDFIVRCYDNSIGKFRVSKWRFNGKENIFEEIDHWLE